MRRSLLTGLLLAAVGPLFGQAAKPLAMPQAAKAVAVRGALHVLYGVNGKAATNVDRLTRRVTDLAPSSPLVVQVRRQGVLRYLVLTGE